jgi:hypothetical protein
MGDIKKQCKNMERPLMAHLEDAISTTVAIVISAYKVLKKLKKTIRKPSNLSPIIKFFWVIMAMSV